MTHFKLTDSAATFDNVTDDLSAIQSFINTNGAGTYVWPKDKTAFCNGTLSTPANVVITGGGKHRSQIRGNGVDRLIIASGNLEVSHMWVEAGLEGIYGTSGDLVLKQTNLNSATQTSVRWNGSSAIVDGVNIKNNTVYGMVMRCNHMVNACRIYNCFNGYSHPNVGHGQISRSSARTLGNHAFVALQDGGGTVVRRVFAKDITGTGIVSGRSGGTESPWGTHLYFFDSEIRNATLLGITVDPTYGGDDTLLFNVFGKIERCRVFNAGISGYNATHTAELDIVDCISVDSNDNGLGCAQCGRIGVKNFWAYDHTDSGVAVFDGLDVPRERLGPITIENLLAYGVVNEVEANGVTPVVIT